MIVLDTSIVIHLRDGDTAIESRIEQLTEEIAVSAITCMELENGVYRDPALIAVRRARVDELLSIMTVLPFDDAAANAYGRTIAKIGYSRRKVLDRMIGVQALMRQARLASMNPADFSDIPGLQVEAW